MGSVWRNLIRSRWDEQPRVYRVPRSGSDNCECPGVLLPVDIVGRANGCSILLGPAVRPIFQHQARAQNAA